MVETTNIKRKKDNLINKIILLFNLVAAAMLLISQLSSKISPKQIWIAEIISLGYPVFLLINIFFVVYWLLQKKRFIFISIVIILLGYDKLNQIYQFGLFKIDIQPGAKSFNVMTYNVRLFDLYNWNGNIKTKNQIFDLLERTSPEILCMQEYYTSENKEQKFNNTDTLAQITKLNYQHIEYSITLRKTDHWGIATYSEYPIVNKGKIFFKKGSNNFGIFTDIKIDNDTLRIYNVHLQSNHFKKNDYQFLENPDSGSNEEIYQGAKGIIRRLKNGAIRRTDQVDALVENMKNCNHAYVVCGDFNDPPFSYVYQRLIEIADDSFLKAGKGFGVTYTETFAPFRIDYILHSKNLKANSFKIINKRLSDHYPVISNFEFKKVTE